MAKKISSLIEKIKGDTIVGETLSYHFEFQLSFFDINFKRKQGF